MVGSSFKKVRIALLGVTANELALKRVVTSVKPVPFRFQFPRYTAVNVPSYLESLVLSANVLVNTSIGGAILVQGRPKN